MTQENIPPSFNINFKAYNSGEEVPFITISNSKSNSSKNQNSKTSSNNPKISFTKNNNSSSNSKKNRQNLSFNIIRKKLSRNNNNQDKNSFEIFTFTDSSLLKNLAMNEQENHISNNSMSEDQKEIQTEIKNDKKPDIETPKKKYDNSSAIFQKLKIKKKIKPIENIIGKNLMEYFNYTYEKSKTGEKNENIISSFKNISNPTFNLKENTEITNKSWNKNNYAKINVNKMPIKIINNYNKNIFNDKNSNKINIKDSKDFSPISKSIQKKSSNNFKISNPKKSPNIIISVDIAQRLLSKYMPKKNVYNINNKNIIFKNSNFKNIVNTKKIKNVEKMKKTPKSESYHREISNPYLKIRESASKNLFHDFQPKLSDEINLNKNSRINKKRLSAKIIKNKNSKYELNDLCKMINKRNGVVKIKPIENESVVNENINVSEINAVLNCHIVSPNTEKKKNLMVIINSNLNITHKFIQFLYQKI